MSDTHIDLSRIIHARDKAALIVVADQNMAKPFELIDNAAQALEANDPVARARAIAANRAAS